MRMFFKRHIIKAVLNQEWTQIFAILTAAIVALNTGLLYAWPSPSIPILISEEYPINITLEEASYTTVIPSIASILSSPLYPYLMDRYGRKPVLLSMAIPQLLSWIIIARANSIYVIYASRFLSGLANSCLYATLPVYIGEIASPNVRGLWGNAMSCSIYFGSCLMNIIGGSYSIEITAYIFGFLPIVFFFIFLFMPESPYYYLMRGHEDKAKLCLRSLRKSDDVEKEFLEISFGVERQLSESSSLKDMFRIRSNLRGLLICVFVRGAQQFAGISAFAVYSQYLFIQANSDISASASAIIFTAALTVGSCTGSIFLDKLGRRLAMILSCLGCAIILLGESCYFYFANDLLKSYNISLPYFPIIGMLLYVPLYSIGLGIVPNLLLGELFSSNVKGKALCLLNISFGIYSSISTKVFQLLSSGYGMFAPFLLFGVCCLFSAGISFFYIPETKGKTLEEIQIDLKGNVKQPDVLLTRM